MTWVHAMLAVELAVGAWWATGFPKTRAALKAALADGGGA